MIEAHYSKHISDVSYTVVRRNMIDVDGPPVGNVIPLR
jgi:hypothetical protein